MSLKKVYNDLILNLYIYFNFKFQNLVYKYYLQEDDSGLLKDKYQTAEEYEDDFM